MKNGELFVLKAPSSFGKPAIPEEQIASKIKKHQNMRKSKANRCIKASKNLNESLNKR